MGWTELHGAAGDGDTEEVKRLLDRGLNVHEQDNGGLTALHVAAEEGAAEAAKLLCLNGANPYAQSKIGQETCLHFAASEGHLDCVHVLTKTLGGVCFEVKDENCEGDRHAAERCHEDCFKLSIQETFLSRRIYGQVFDGGEQVRCGRPQMEDKAL
eukprot:768556-Hanusia_phi.AAC.6